MSSFKLNLQLLRDYPSKKFKGERTYVYVVTGSADALDAYENAKGDYLVIDKDTDKHLWFSNKNIGNLGELIVTAEGKDFPNMDWLNKIKSSAKMLFGTDMEMQMHYIRLESEKHMNAGQKYRVANTTEETVEESNEAGLDEG